MLHIILLILKIIGIVLLCILGVIVLSMLLVLFVPVRYRIEAVREAGEGKPPVTVRVRVTWLLHLVNILVRYPADMIIRVRLMLFTIFRIPGREKAGQKQKKDRKQRGRREEVQDSTADDTDRGEAPGVESGAAYETDGSEAEAGRTDGGDYVPLPADDVFMPFEMGALEDGVKQQEPEAAVEADDVKASLPDKILQLLEKIKSLIGKFRQTVDKIKAIFENIQYTIRKFCDKIKATLDNIQYYLEILESDSFKRSASLCRDELGYVFRKLRPDRFEADLTIGMEDPAATGQILAFYGMLYPLIGEHVRLVGDFAGEGTHIEGKVYVRGKVRAYTFLRVLIRVYRNKDVRKLIRLLRKKEAVIDGRE